MNAFLLYLLKANMILVLLYGFYALFLKRDTFYAHHRWYLLLTLLAIVFFPLINVRMDSWFSESATTAMISEYVPSVTEIYQVLFSIYPEKIPMTEGATVDEPVIGSINGITIWVLLVGMVAAYLICKRFIQFGRMMGLVYRSRKHPLGNRTVIFMDHPASPFSFFNWIFLPSDIYSEEDLNEIFEHEQIHCRNRHSADILLSELVTCLCWFNPFAWMMRNDLRQNIEYYTDSRMLQKGFDRKHYQYHLLKVTGNGHYSIVNHFYFNHLKKRIMKMNKKNSPSVLYLKYLLAFPLLMAAMLLVRASGIEETIASIPETEKIFFQNITNGLEKSTFIDTTPSESPATDRLIPLIIPVGINEPDNQSATPTLLYLKAQPSSYYGDSLKVRPYILYGDDSLKVRHITPSGDTISSISSIWSRAAAPFAWEDSSFMRDALIIINGKEASKEVFNKLPQDNIHSFSVLRDASATALYKEKGKNGAIMVVTKDAPDELKKGTDTQKTDESTSAKFFNRGITSGTQSAMIIIDGEESAKEKMAELSPDDIHSFSILKDSSATALYGEKGKNGVVMVVTKDAPDELKKGIETQKTGESTSAEFFIRGITSGTRNPMIFIDREESSKEKMAELSPDDIHSFSILKDASAIALYGEKGKNGVVMVVTKDAPDELKKGVYTQKTGEPASIKFFNSGITSGTQNQMIIINGEESSREVFNKLPQKNIHSFSFLNKASATDLYGEKGKNGAIIIFTKDAPDELKKGSNTNEKHPKSGSSNPSIIDGKEAAR